MDKSDCLRTVFLKLSNFKICGLQLSESSVSKVELKFWKLKSTYLQVAKFGKLRFRERMNPPCIF